jgi:hypothetical protein
MRGVSVVSADSTGLFPRCFLALKLQLTALS